MFDTVYWVLKYSYHFYTCVRILGCTQYAPISFPLFQLHNFLLPIKQFLRKLWLIRFTKKSCNRFQCSTEIQKNVFSVLGWYDSKKAVFLKWCLQLWWWDKYTDILIRLNPAQIYIYGNCVLVFRLKMIDYEAWTSLWYVWKYIFISCFRDIFALLECVELLFKSDNIISSIIQKSQCFW